MDARRTSITAVDSAFYRSTGYGTVHLMLHNNGISDSSLSQRFARACRGFEAASVGVDRARIIRFRPDGRGAMITRLLPQMRVAAATTSRAGGILTISTSARGDSAGCGDEVGDCKCSNSASPVRRVEWRGVKLGEILVKGAEHFQNRLLVGEEAAHHLEIGGRDGVLVKSLKTAGGEFDHFPTMSPGRVVRGADDGVGDQMRPNGSGSRAPDRDDSGVS